MSDKRLVYAFDNAESALRAIGILRELGYGKEQISVIARSDIQLDAIPADLQDVSKDTVPGALRGAAVGGATGMLAGIVAMAIPPLGIAAGGAALLSFFTGGALLGAWSSALVGASVPSETERNFEEQVAQGRVLVCVDAPASAQTQIASALGSQLGGHLLWQGDAPPVEAHKV